MTSFADDDKVADAKAADEKPAEKPVEKPKDPYQVPEGATVKELLAFLKDVKANPPKTRPQAVAWQAALKGAAEKDSTARH